MLCKGYYHIYICFSVFNIWMAKMILIMHPVDVHFSEKYYGENISLFESISRIHVERTLTH